MRLTGLHHVTAICRDLDRTTGFYRDVLGLALVEQGVNDDDPSTRHFWFGDANGTLIVRRERDQRLWSIDAAGCAYAIPTADVVTDAPASTTARAA